MYLELRVCEIRFWYIPIQQTDIETNSKLDRRAFVFLFCIFQQTHHLLHPIPISNLLMNTQGMNPFFVCILPLTSRDSAVHFHCTSSACMGVMRSDLKESIIQRQLDCKSCLFSIMLQSNLSARKTNPSHVHTNESIKIRQTTTSATIAT